MLAGPDLPLLNSSDANFFDDHSDENGIEEGVNKQLNDKERVAAALENPNLVDMVDECLAPSYA
ncbi:hypothetical protein LguiA_012980 [Lonicera macranthoides]